MYPPPRDPVNLNRLVYFAHVVEAGSFTRAAERLGITKAVVSQQVARLEQEIGTTLLLRTTRKVAPTDAGRALHARCVVILRESAEAFDELAQGTTEPRGTLRVTAPFDYGASVVAPLAAEFTRTYPHCDVDLALSDRLIDIQTVDMAIRVGWPRDSSQVTRRIGTMEQYAVCAPKIERLLGSGSEPDDLGLLPFIANSALAEPNVWRFTHTTRGRRTIRMRARITVDATPAARISALAGGGFSVLPDYLVRADLAAGRLVRLIPDWKLKSGGIHVLFPSTRFRPPRVTRFFEAMLRAEAGRRSEPAG